MTLHNEKEVPPWATFPARAPSEDARWSPTDLADVWRHLAEGTEVVVEAYFSDVNCALVLGPRRGASQLGRGRQLQVLNAVLRGTGQKRVAIELAIAPSTVALNAKVALEHMGVHTRPSRVHPLLVLAASAATHAHARVPAFEASVLYDGQPSRVVVVQRPDEPLRGLLPKAEQEVLGQLIEGQCYAEISRGRGTSARTIANQIAGAFRRLGVSGRAELLQRLFVMSGWLPSLPRAA